jgi:hypothetical protein
MHQKFRANSVRVLKGKESKESKAVAGQTLNLVDN